MKSKRWKTALWNTSWSELHKGEHSEEGSCDFKTEKGALLEIPFGDITQSRALSQTGMYSVGLETKTYDSLVGITQDGIRLVLLDVVSLGVGSSAPGSTCENLEARVALEAHGEIRPEARICRAVLRMQGLKEWLDCRYYPKREEDELRIAETGMHEETVLVESEAYDVVLQRGLEKPRVTGTRIETQTYAQFELRVHNPMPLDDLLAGPVWKLQSLCAFMLGFYPPIDSLALSNEDGVSGIQAYLASFPVASRKVSGMSVPVSYDAIGAEGLSRIASNWFLMDGDECHGCEMLTSLLGPWQMPFDLHVASATTMLEALARARNGDLYDSDELNQMLEPAIKELPDEIRDRARGLLGLIKRPSYPILLDSVYEECRPWSEDLIHDWKRFKSEQIKIRNKGAHGLAGSNNYEAMAHHYYGQIVLAYYLLMMRLGLGQSAMQHFEESSFLNAARWRLKSAYA